MSAYTSTQSGPWSDPATWGGAGPPGTGDTATVNHAVAITAATAIGDGSDTTVLALDTTASSLTIAAGVAFTIRGNATFGAYNGGGLNTYLTLAAGASLILDSATGPVLTFDYDSKVVINGSSGSRCTIDGKGGAGLPGRFTGNNHGRNLNTVAAYCDFSNLGDASNSGWGVCFLSDVSGQVATFDRCTFAGCGTAPYLFLDTDDPDVSLTRCSWSSPAAVPMRVTCTRTKAGGTRLVDSCVFDGTFAVVFNSQRNFTITNNYFGASLQSAIESPSWDTFSGNFLRQIVTQESLFGGDVADCYHYADGGGGSFCLVTDFQDFTYSGNLFDPSAAVGPGYCIGFTEASNGPRPASSVTGNVLVPAGTDWHLLSATTNSGAANPLAAGVTRNTAAVAPTSATVGVRASGSGERVGSILEIVDNLFWAVGAPAGLSVANYGNGDPDVGVVTDVVTAANCHHNAYSSAAVQPAAYWTATHPTAGATTCNDGTIYSTPMSGSTPPGAADVDLGTIADAATQGPMFLDPARNFAAWCAHKGYADVATGLAAIRADLTLIADARDWVRAGFAPTNPLLATAAHDGATIGAIPYLAPAADYTLTAPSPTKGDLTVASGNFTVTPGASFTGTITPSDGGTGGTFTPASLTWTGTSEARTFTYTPTRWGNRTVSTTNDGALTDPDPVAYLAMVQLGGSGTAPSGNRAPAFGGYDLFAVGAWWQEFTRDVRTLPVDPHSDAIMGHFSGGPHLYMGNLSTTTGDGGNSLYGMPINVVPGDQATKILTVVTYYPESDVDSTTHQAPVPIPDDPSIEGYYDAGGDPPTAVSGDQHMLIAVRNEVTGGIDALHETAGVVSSDGGTTWSGSVLATFDLTTGRPRPEGYTSADAAGLPILPLLLKYEEVARGDVGHVLRGTFSNFMLMSRYTWPGRHETGQMGTARTYLAYGGRLRLKDAWYQANRGSFSGQGLVILDALAKYGLINSDGSGFGLGTGATIEGVNDERWSLSELGQLTTVPMTAFEVVRQYDSYTVSGPASGPVGVAAMFTLTKYPAGDSNFSGSVYLRVDGVLEAPGISTTAVNLDDEDPSGDFTFTPPADGVYTIAMNQGNQDWIDAPDIVFTAGSPGSTVEYAAATLMGL